MERDGWVTTSLSGGIAGASISISARPGKSVEKKRFALWLTNERFAMTHHPVGCFGEISLKLEPFHEVQRVWYKS